MTRRVPTWVSTRVTSPWPLAAWSVRWRLPSIDTRGRSLPSTLVVVALLAAVAAVLYSLLAEGVVIGSLGTLVSDPLDFLNPYHLRKLQPFFGCLVLTAGLSVVVLATVRAARWPWAVAIAWIALMVWVIWPAQVVLRGSGWNHGSAMGTNVFSWYPHTGRSGLLWLILGISVCLAIKLRGARGATPPR